VERHRGLSLPLGPPPSCITTVVKEAQQHWPAHVRNFTIEMAVLVESVCHALCSTYYKEYPKLAARMR
jgi:hypothetical protein